jgi:anti-sigma-K factor RskA
MEQSSFVQILHSRKFWALVIALVAIMAGYGTGNLDAWQAIQALVAALAAYSTGVAIEDAGFKAGAGNVTPAKETAKETAVETQDLASLPGSGAGRASMVTEEKELPAAPDIPLKTAGPAATENTVPPNESAVAPEGKVLRQQLARPFPRKRWEG